MHNFTNSQLTKLLREVAAAYTLKKAGNIFQIRAYETAADVIEHSTSEIKDLWEEGHLAEVPTLGERIQGYLDELFKTGKVKHFEVVKKGIPEIVFELLDIPGVGPKTAQEVAKLGVKNIDNLKEQIKSGKLIKKGFSAKIAEKIMAGLEQSNNKTGRMLLPYAFAQAEKILDYLKKSEDVIKADPLGSLRRMVATIGDLDFSASSKNPKKVVGHFVKMPGVKEVLDQGNNKASVILGSGIRIDLLVGEPDTYGALLQHFTGSKQHNIHLRTFAEKVELSISEYGVKKLKSDKVIPCKTEEELYSLLKMQTPAPEIREDTGEIEAALRSAQGKSNGLPVLVKLDDIKGDFHLHSNFPIEKPSHGPGVDKIEDIVKQAAQLGYEIVGISDHSPSPTLSKEQISKTIEKRTKFIQELKQKTKSVRVLNGLEIDILPDGTLSVPNEVLKTLDYCIAGIHSVHKGTKEQITKRLIKALENPNVNIISHPTNRLLNERGSSEADWEEVFKICAKNKKVLEINSYPNRLDLRDDLVRLAKQYGVKFIINTDAHAVAQMDTMRFGVAVARRGWATKEDVVNSWSFEKLTEWFKIKG